jgi:hypothetical protein
MLESDRIGHSPKQSLIDSGYELLVGESAFVLKPEATTMLSRRPYILQDFAPGFPAGHPANIVALSARVALTAENDAIDGVDELAGWQREQLVERRYLGFVRKCLNGHRGRCRGPRRRLA